MTQFIVRKIILVLMIAVIYSCNLEKENKSTASKTQTLFTLLDAKETGIDFLNKVKNQKNFNIFKPCISLFSGSSKIPRSFPAKLV